MKRDQKHDSELFDFSGDNIHRLLYSFIFPYRRKKKKVPSFEKRLDYSVPSVSLAPVSEPGRMSYHLLCWDCLPCGSICSSKGNRKFEECLWWTPAWALFLVPIELTYSGAHTLGFLPIKFWVTPWSFGREIPPCPSIGFLSLYVSLLFIFFLCNQQKSTGFKGRKVFILKLSMKGYSSWDNYGNIKYSIAPVGEVKLSIFRELYIYKWIPNHIWYFWCKSTQNAI